jgi:hypothetical protein
MIHPDLDALPQFYRRYVENVKNYDLIEALKISSQETLALVNSLTEEMGTFRYAPEKWSIKELLCHMIDAERIMCYRALRFARNDKTPLHGFEENDYAPEANANNRDLKSIAGEMSRLRASTIDMFISFTDEMLNRKGLANNAELSVVNLGYIISGHETHHRKILQERYLSAMQ